MRATDRLGETRATLAKRLAALGREIDLARIEAAMAELDGKRLELVRLGAAVAQRQVALATAAGRLEVYAYLAEQLESLLPDGRTRGTVRGRREDLLAQLAIARQGLLGLQLVQDAGDEGIREIDRAAKAAVERSRRRVLGS